MTSKMADSSLAPSRPSSSSGTPRSDNSAIYYEISPTIVFIVRLFNVLVLLMVAIAFILCMIQAPHNKSFYLLSCNIIISSFVGIVINWWYRSGDLGSEKYWFIILVGVVILIQTITTDIFVFRSPPTPQIPLSTSRPIINVTTTHLTPVTLANSTTTRLVRLPIFHPNLPESMDVY